MRRETRLWDGETLKGLRQYDDHIIRHYYTLIFEIQRTRRGTLRE